MRRCEERALLSEPPLVFFQQAGCMQRQPELPSDSLGEQDLGDLPGPRLRPVQPEHADHLVEDDHGRRECRSCAEPGENVTAAEGWIVELSRVLDVVDRDCPALACGEVGNR